MKYLRTYEEYMSNTVAAATNLTYSDTPMSNGDVTGKSLDTDPYIYNVTDVKDEPVKRLRAEERERKRKKRLKKYMDRDVSKVSDDLMPYATIHKPGVA